MLRMAVPGNPGEDYPIYDEVPETVFSCEGRVEGGYYADPEAECQPFHVCSADRDGGLTKNSFLCPNGTLFNQENFVCEYWFNMDCSQAESFYGLNDNIGIVEGGDGLAGAASSPTGGYASPPDTPLSSYGLGDENKSLRSGRREGRLIADARRNGASPQVTQPKSLNSRFVNFPFNNKSPNPNIKVSESKIQSKKNINTNDRKTSSPRANLNTRTNPNINLNEPKIQSKKKINTINRKTKSARANINARTRRPNILKERNQNRPIATKLFQPARNINRNLSKNVKTTRNQPARGGSLSTKIVQDTKRRTGKISKRRNPPNQKQVREGRNEVLTGYLPPAGDPAAASDSYAAGDSSLAASSADYDYEEAPLATYAGASDDVDAFADAVYEEDTLPTYNNGVYNNVNSDDGSSYSAPVVDSVYGSDSDYEDILPAYNNGVYNNAGLDSYKTEGTSYTAPSADSYGAPADSAGDGYGSPSANPSDSYGIPLADSDYEEDILPQYNKGVYNDGGSTSSATGGTSYTAPTSDSYGAPSETISDSYGSPLADSDYEEDILPQYNNGVYNNGG